jgi:hypothetical protein
MSRTQCRRMHPSAGVRCERYDRHDGKHRAELPEERTAYEGGHLVTLSVVEW